VFSPPNEEEDVKASAAESEAGVDEVEEDETNELRRNGAVEAPISTALQGRARLPIADAEILPELRERDAIGEASASAMVGAVTTHQCCGLPWHIFYLIHDWMRWALWDSFWGVDNLAQWTKSSLTVGFIFFSQIDTPFILLLTPNNRMEGVSLYSDPSCGARRAGHHRRYTEVDVHDGRPVKR
jgi:hypothetical protein